MSSYNARLQLPGRTRIPMSVTVDVTSESLSLITDDATIGKWPLNEVKVDPRSDGFHIVIEGEEVVLKVAEAASFASEMNLPPPVTQPVRHLNGSTRAETRAKESSLINQRIGGHGHEDLLIEIRGQINNLKEAVSDPSIPPSAFFASWLSLLKTINQSHGDGAMPSPVFFRLNSELLEIMPVPERAEPAAVTV